MTLDPGKDIPWADIQASPEWEHIKSYLEYCRGKVRETYENHSFSLTPEMLRYYQGQSAMLTELIKAPDFYLSQVAAKLDNEAEDERRRRDAAGRRPRFGG